MFAQIKRLLTKKFALFVEKVSFQLIGVAIILTLLKFSLTSILISMLWIYVSEVVWFFHPKTRADESVSLFLLGMFTLYFSSLPESASIALILKSFGILLLIVGGVRTICKVSAHTAGTSFMFAIASMFGHALLSMFALIILPIVSWSRLKLKRHTLMQVIVGIILGIVIPILLI